MFVPNEWIRRRGKTGNTHVDKTGGFIRKSQVHANPYEGINCLRVYIAGDSHTINKITYRSPKLDRIVGRIHPERGRGVTQDLPGKGRP
jgi:hypothetical protein